MNMIKKALCGLAAIVALGSGACSKHSEYHFEGMIDEQQICSESANNRLRLRVGSLMGELDSCEEFDYSFPFGPKETFEADEDLRVYQYTYDEGFIVGRRHPFPRITYRAHASSAKPEVMASIQEDFDKYLAKIKKGKEWF